MENLLKFEDYTRISKVLETEFSEEYIDELIEDVELSNDDTLDEELTWAMAIGIGVLGGALINLLTHLAVSIQRQVTIKKQVAKEKDPKKAAALNAKLQKENADEIFIRKQIRKQKETIKKKAASLDKDKVKLDPKKAEKIKLKIDKLNANIKFLEKTKATIKTVRIADTQLKKDKKESKSKYRKERSAAVDKYHKTTRKANKEYDDYVYKK